MFGSDILDVLIGLFLVFFLFSLLCSGVNELILGHLKRLRATMLEAGIRKLLGDPKIADAFFSHPLITGLSPQDGRNPSYIPPNTFVDALMAVVKEAAPSIAPHAPATGVAPPVPDVAALRTTVAALGASPTARVLLSLISEAAHLPEARQRMEQWFNDGMDRVTGWYKSTAQWWLILWATVATIAFNVDTIAITQTLANDSKLRAALVAAAQETAKTPPPAASNTNSVAQNQEAMKSVTAQIQSLHLPLGWSVCPEHWGLKILGLLLSIAALSLGAPFWFDLLNKAVNMRAGLKPGTKQATTTKIDVLSPAAPETPPQTDKP